MNCLNCGAPMRLEPEKDFYVCEYCTSIFFPEKNKDGVRPLEELSKVNCPVCRLPLSTGAIEGERILFCLKCAGILMKQWAFMHFVQYMRARSSADGITPPRPLNTDELARIVNCPSCSRKMNTHPYLGPGNVIIDNCLKCKIIWLDYGELNQIITMLAR